MSKRLNADNLPGALHFVTLNVRDRKAPFSRPEYAQMILELLRFECDRHPATLAAYVATPDHLHFLFGPQDGNVSRFLTRLKPNSCLNLDAIALKNGRQRDRDWLCEKGKRELWQDGKYSLPIFSSPWIREKIEYIHANPVRRGLVENPGDYPYSSLWAYYPISGKSAPVKVDLVKA